MGNDHSIFLIDNAIIFDFNDSTLIGVASGESIRLLAPSSHCLYCLVTQKGNVVSRPALMERGWGQFGFVVSANTLNQNILLIRKAISQLSDREIIKTIFKQGLVIPDHITIQSFPSMEEARRFLNNASEIASFSDAMPVKPEPDMVPESLPQTFIKRLLKKTIARCKAMRDKKEILQALLLLLVFILPVIYIYHSIHLSLTDKISNLKVINSYTKTADYKSCSIFSRSQNINTQSVVGYLEKLQISCAPPQPIFIYYGSYPEINRVSIIVCNKGISAAFSECHSFYLLT